MTDTNEEKVPQEEQITVTKAEWETLTQTVERLQKHADTVLAEKKEEQDKRQKAQKDKDDAIRAKALIDDDAKQLKELLKASEDARVALEGTIKERDERDAKRSLNDEALKIAGELTKHSGRQDDLARYIKERIQITPEGLKVLDKNGKLTVSTVDDLKTELTKTKDWLIDGVPSTGADVHGSVNVTPVKSFKDLTEKEVVELARNDPKAFAALT